MKILHILDVRWDSGIMRYGLNLAKAQKDRGHDVRVWALKGKPPFDAAKELGIPVSDCTGLWTKALGLRRELAQQPVDVVNAHSGTGHSLAAALNLTLRRPFALVRTRGDARPLTAKGSIPYRRTHGFIAANAAILENFRALFGPELPARTVYWGMDWPDPGPPESGTPPRIGIVARLDPVKGHGTLLKAAAAVIAKHPTVELWIAGPEVNITAEELEKQAAELNIAKSVHVLGKVGRIRDFFRTCAVGVVASNGSEAVSRAAVEWMASGRPLVATSVGCLPELVEEGKTGFLVPPEDPEAMAAALETLAADAGLRAAMGRAARKRFERLYTAETFVTDTQALYEQALHRLPS